MITGYVGDVWFDNLMAKPPLIDNVSPYSVLVFFEVVSWGEGPDGEPNPPSYHTGQFCFGNRMWDVIPTEMICGNPHHLQFHDKCVRKWMHIPGGPVIPTSVPAK